MSEKNLHVEVKGSVTDRVGCVTPPPHLLAIESFREKDLMASLTSNSPTSTAPDLSSEMHPLKQTQVCLFVCPILLFFFVFEWSWMKSSSHLCSRPKPLVVDIVLASETVGYFPLHQ